MKVIFVLLSILLGVAQMEDCTKSTIFKCAEKALMDNKCEASETVNGVTTHYLTSCSSDETCAAGQISVCKKRVWFKRFEKQKCSVNPDCYSNICTDGVCVSIPDGLPCTLFERNNHVSGCSNLSRCDSETLKCVALLKEGAECVKPANNPNVDAEECGFNLRCSKVAPADAKGKCVKMFSVDTGKYADNFELCKSAKLEPHPDTGIPVCVETTTTATTCTTDADCKYTINYGDKNVTGVEITNPPIKGCKCAASAHKGYCFLATDNEVWTSYIKMYQDEIDGLEWPEDKSIAILRPLHWGIPRLLNGASQVDYYQAFREADECAINFLLSSNTIRYTVMMLFTLLVALL